MANTTGKKFGGRKKGTPNKTTSQLRELIAKFADDTFEDVVASWNAIEDDSKKVDAWVKLVEYALPKLARSEVKMDDSETKTIIFKRYKDEAGSDE